MRHCNSVHPLVCSGVVCVVLWIFFIYLPRTKSQCQWCKYILLYCNSDVSVMIAIFLSLKIEEFVTNFRDWKVVTRKSIHL